MTVLLLFCWRLHPLLTGKRRSTVEPGTCEDSLWPAMQHGCTARASSRIAILVSKPQMYTGSNATSLLLQLCLLRERAGLRPRVPTTLLLETVRLRPWTRGLMLLRERTGLWPRVTTTFLRRTVRFWPWAGDLFCPELRVLQLLWERAGHRPRVPTTLPRETVRLRLWTRVLFCPEFRVLRLIPTGVETRIPTGVEIRTNFRSRRQRFLHAAHARRLYQPSCGQQ